MACQIDHLCELPNDAARQKALNNLPSMLHATYQRILQRVNKSNAEVQKMVRQALQWLGCSKAKLSTAALCQATPVEKRSNALDRMAIPDEDEVRYWCSSLVRKSVSGDYLELAHFTVKEYLLSNDKSSNAELGLYHINSKLADLEMAEICLTYLAFEDPEDQAVGCGNDPFQEKKVFAFHEYAVLNWHRHARDHLNDAGLL